MGRSGLLRTARSVALAAVVGALAIQLVPYGWSRPNPPVARDAPWPNAEAERVARQSCYSCHSNETEWPSYAYVAPFSWLVRRDVEQGRDELNFSRWDRDDGKADDAIEVVVDGEMPPRRYTLAHPGARLSSQERRTLIDALRAMDADR